MQIAHNDTYGGRLLSRVEEQEAREVAAMNAKPLAVKRGTEEATGNAAYWAERHRRERMSKEPRS